MKVLLVWISLAIAVKQSYSLVLNQEKIELLPSKINLNNTLTLCTDHHGNRIFGANAYKEDCRKYVQCGLITNTIMSCGAGSLFSEEYRVCVWPREANCIEFRAKQKSKLVIPVSEIKW